MSLFAACLHYAVLPNAVFCCRPRMNVSSKAWLPHPTPQPTVGGWGVYGLCGGGWGGPVATGTYIYIRPRLSWPPPPTPLAWGVPPRPPLWVWGGVGVG